MGFVSFEIALIRKCLEVEKDVVNYCLSFATALTVVLVSEEARQKH